jgi:hypothetical protein
VAAGKALVEEKTARQAAEQELRVAQERNASLNQDLPETNAARTEDL